ncbi:type IV pilin N-terminal domain-containing protein [Halosolutus halophilus]|uniref:type IV pilin N-terminal domain-containing protein n=1 Tax=Halosolutus halophilus TaxID=1552990 RepID=UPI0022351D15|nr:type IV pilin N-terminal domain-containing protein [Halosolutus halophilus]
MNLENYRKKLIGNEEERAVSPVIGVILMVAITVILAAVIAAFVLDLGGGLSENANAGVDTAVDNTDGEVTVSVKSMGNAEEIVLRGDVDDSLVDEVDGSTGDYDETSDALTQAGTSITLGYTASDGESGTVTVVAITADGTETQVASQEFDFSS